MRIEFSIWMASKTRWAHLVKKVRMPIVPRVGEYLKFRNRQVGEYFGWQVTQVTYRESGAIEVWTELLDNIDDRGYSFDTEEEFDEYFQAYLREGWKCDRGIRPNRRILSKGSQHHEAHEEHEGIEGREGSEGQEG